MTIHTHTFIFFISLFTLQVLYIYTVACGFQFSFFEIPVCDNKWICFLCLLLGFFSLLFVLSYSSVLVFVLSYYNPLEACILFFKKRLFSFIKNRFFSYTIYPDNSFPSLHSSQFHPTYLPFQINSLFASH